jgi:hypothetical protein
MATESGLGQDIDTHDANKKTRFTGPPSHAGHDGPPRGEPSAENRGPDHRLRRIDALRLSSRAVFALWMIAFEKSPWPTLTLIVSLEAIFLSTFVMIGQNRQAAFQQAKADHDFVESELELKKNTQLTRQIHTLTTELHRRVVTDGRG